MQYLKHYWVRDGKFLTEIGENGPLQSHPTQFVKGPLRVEFWLQDERGVDYCLSTTDDSSLVTEITPGLEIISRQEWDAIVATIPQPEEPQFPEGPQEPNWDTFETVVFQSTEMKSFIDTAASQNILIASALPAAFYEAKKGNYSSFKIVWNEIIKIATLNPAVVENIVAVASTCNLPQEFITIFAGNAT